MKVRTLLQVEPYFVMGSELGKLKSYSNGRSYYEKHLPEYCFRKDNNTINESKYYLQYVYDGNEKYIVFDINTADKLLEQEINESGFHGKYGLLLYDQNDSYNENAFYDIVTNHFEIYPFEKYNRSYPVAQYIVVELEYYGGTYEYPYDLDLNFTIIGHLNDNLNFIEYDKNEK